MTRATTARKRYPSGGARTHVVRVDPQRASCTLRTPICRHFAVAFAFAASRARPRVAEITAGGPHVQIHKGTVYWR